MTSRGTQEDRSHGLEPSRMPAAVDGTTPGPAFAHWGRRVLATFLDSAVLGLLTWLAFPVQPVSPPTPLPLAMPTATSHWATPAADVWTSSGVVVSAVVVGLLMQAYLGSTPGKLVAGIAVVRLTDHRPAGLLRVLGREVLHVLDALLLIGYLRPLWHRRRETFADTISSTVVLQTRAPLPYALDGPVVGRWRHGQAADRTAGDGPDAPWQLPSSPRWRMALTAGATVACVAAAGFAWGGESGTGGALVSTCDTAEQSGRSLTLTGAQVEVRDGGGTRTRLGMTRQLAAATPGVVVAWTWEGEWSSDDDLQLRVGLRDATGVERRWRFPYTGDGLDVPPGQGLLDRPEAVLLPLDALAGFDDSVTVTADAVLNGAPLPGCTVETVLPSRR